MARKKKDNIDISFEGFTADPVEEAPVADAPAADVQEEVVTEEKPASVEKPIQVKKNKVIFVPFEDFEGRINENTFNFKKDVAVECTVDEAHTWVDAKKGYIK